MKSKQIAMFAVVVVVSYLSLLLPKNSKDIQLIVFQDRLLFMLV